MFHVKPSEEHRSPPTPLSWASIQNALESIGLQATSEECRDLARHAAMVIEVNREFNLTRISEPVDFERLHVLDSSSVVPSVLAAPAGVVADLGSGSGYPGIVVAILTRQPTVLVESVKKKANFLNSCVSELDLDATVFADRAESLAQERAGGFACVTARALASLPSLVELAAPLLVDGGRLVAMKARPSDEELASGREAAHVCGMKEIEQVAVRVSSDQQRILVIYERIGPAKVPLPRRIGLAQRSPLA